MGILQEQQQAREGFVDTNTLARWMANDPCEIDPVRQAWFVEQEYKLLLGESELGWQGFDRSTYHVCNETFRPVMPTADIGSEMHRLGHVHALDLFASIALHTNMLDMQEELGFEFQAGLACGLTDSTAHEPNPILTHMEYDIRDPNFWEAFEGYIKEHGKLNLTTLDAGEGWVSMMGEGEDSIRIDHASPTFARCVYRVGQQTLDEGILLLIAPTTYDKRIFYLEDIFAEAGLELVRSLGRKMFLRKTGESQVDEQDFVVEVLTQILGNKNVDSAQYLEYRAI